MRRFLFYFVQRFKRRYGNFDLCEADFAKVPAPTKELFLTIAQPPAEQRPRRWLLGDADGFIHVPPGSEKVVLAAVAVAEHGHEFKLDVLEVASTPHQQQSAQPCAETPSRTRSPLYAPVAMEREVVVIE